MARRCTAREGLDDDHAAAAARTGMRVVVIGGIGRLGLGLGGGEQLAGAQRSDDQLTFHSSHSLVEDLRPAALQLVADGITVYDPMRDEMFLSERGKGAYLNGRPLRVSSATELQKSLLVTGFPYNAWNTPQDNFANFVKFAKMTQGVRRLGSAALDLCYVGAGRFDGFWEMSLNPWDVAAGGLIAEEAGARVTSITGDPDYLSPPQSVVASTPGIHARMLEELNGK